MAEPRRSAAKDAPDRDSSDLEGARILVVEARFYEDIADALLAGATRALQEAGAIFERVSVPGSLEVAPAIAMALDAAERSGRPYEGAVALGCVIRGETLHFEIVSQESARALLELSLARRLPIGNGILTVDTDAQAWTRARPDEADNGGDAARAPGRGRQRRRCRARGTFARAAQAPLGHRLTHGPRRRAQGRTQGQSPRRRPPRGGAGALPDGYRRHGAQRHSRRVREPLDRP
jgi:6,7-dimethyl-8-ribityllumazine synthase